LGRHFSFAFAIEYYALFVVAAIGRRRLHCEQKRCAPKVRCLEWNGQIAGALE
jgi:hypothetical protein